MTVRELFCACNNFQYDDIIIIKDLYKMLYKSTFADVLKTVYAEYTVLFFDYKAMYIEVL
jgi:hypothetical protein